MTAYVLGLGTSLLVCKQSWPCGPQGSEDRPEKARVKAEAPAAPRARTGLGGPAAGTHQWPSPRNPSSFPSSTQQCP